MGAHSVAIQFASIQVAPMDAIAASRWPWSPAPALWKKGAGEKGTEVIKRGEAG